MKRNTFLLICGSTIFLIFTGCAGPTRLAMDYGTSYNMAKFNQMLNPRAGEEMELATGFDGIAAERVMEKYQKGFERTAPGLSPIFTIRGLSPGVGMGGY